MSNLTVDPSLNRWTQNITLIGPHGEPFTTNMGEIEYLRQWGIRLAINWATQIGASLILLLILTLLTKREKRKSAIFITNALCLFLNTVRSFAQCIWLTGEFFNPYSVVANDYSRATPFDYGSTTASNIFLLMLVICIFVSLSLQVWVVCVMMKPAHRVVTMVVTSLFATSSITFRFVVTIISAIQTAKNETMGDYGSLISGMQILQAISVWFYCCIFTFKLGQAIVQRKKLNMNQFGPMQIIFIMGCQTMIVPAIFTSLNFVHGVPELASQSYTVICIFLPLSAIWAGLMTNDASLASDGVDGHQRLLKNQFYNSPPGSANSTTSEKNSISYSPCSFCSKTSSTVTSQRDAKYSTDNAIYVGRDYTVTEESDDSSHKMDV